MKNSVVREMIRSQFNLSNDTKIIVENTSSSTRNDVMYYDFVVSWWDYDEESDTDLHSVSQFSLPHITFKTREY